MREIRKSGSEGGAPGVTTRCPYPYPGGRPKEVAAMWPWKG